MLMEAYQFGTRTPKVVKTDEDGTLLTKPSPSTATADPIENILAGIWSELRKIRYGMELQSGIEFPDPDQ